MATRRDLKHLDTMSDDEIFAIADTLGIKRTEKQDESTAKTMIAMLQNNNSYIDRSNKFYRMIVYNDGNPTEMHFNDYEVLKLSTLEDGEDLTRYNEKLFDIMYDRYTNQGKGHSYALKHSQYMLLLNKTAPNSDEANSIRRQNLAKRAFRIMYPDMDLSTFDTAFPIHKMPSCDTLSSVDNDESVDTKTSNDSESTM